MKATFLTAAIVMAASLASANTYKCVFTEPFLALQASVDQGTVKMEVLGEGVLLETKAGAIQSQNRVAFVFPNLTQFNFTNLYIDLELTGNDGMSDREYAFEGVLQNKDKTTSLYGGCELVK